MEFNDLIETIKSFPEVGGIKIGSSVDGTSPPIVTENELPLRLRETIKERFPKWHIYKIGDPTIHKKDGCWILPLDPQG